MELAMTLGIGGVLGGFRGGVDGLLYAYRACGWATRALCRDTAHTPHADDRDALTVFLELHVFNMKPLPFYCVVVPKAQFLHACFCHA